MVTKHVILIIKKCDKLLTVVDKDWECKLFPHFRTDGNERTEEVWQYLRYKFGWFYANYKFAYEELITKNQVPTNKAKQYYHRYYLVDVTKGNELLDQDMFNVGDTQYQWCTIDELKADECVQNYNLEVVTSVENYLRGHKNG